MQGRHVVAIDQGTTGTTVLVLDEGLEVLARVNREHPQVYPRPGWVEHDPEAIWASTLETLERALADAGAGPGDVAAVGITNQRETTVLWERATGRPVHNAIVWQCRRTADRCAEMKARGLEPLFRERTGLVLDPYFSGTKIAWILDQDPALRRRAEAGELAFGTVDSFLLWRLTGGRVHATDASNASRTLLMDLRRLDWDDELLAHVGVPRAVLPAIRGNAEVLGEVAPGLPLRAGTPVAGMAGDQQAALFGQLCLRPGDAKCTFGTGAFLLMNTGPEPVPSRSGLLTTVGWKVGGRVTYALEGSAFIAGAAVQWLRDGLGIIRSAAEVEALARSVPDSGGVTFVPALTGLGAPHWRPEARGVIAGIDRGVTAGHLARAALEGIALQNTDVLDAMRADSGRALTALRVDGGAAANDLLMQYQADVLEARVVRPRMLETTALGSALMAGLAVGIWQDQEALAGAWKADRTFEPRMTAGEVRAHRARWSAAVAKA
ncbi:glycerol kinase GlpK [Myxococcota bacterium]|nr:glycerol kinase GlpK [Myxococcota bacterium]